MYRAGDERREQPWLDRLDEAATALSLDEAARTRAMDLFLSTAPSSERSKRAVMATALYVGGLTEGDRRTQAEVAAATEVSRLTIQSRWKTLLREAGVTPPAW